MEYAIISSGVVANVIVSNDQAFIDEFYPGSPRIDTLNPKPGIGWAYNGSTFTPPAPGNPGQPKHVFTPQEFRARYTFAELVTVDNFADFPSITEGDRQKMVTITASVVSASSIDITSQNVIDAVNLEAQIGLITPARASQILDPNSAAPAGAWMF